MSSFTCCLVVFFNLLLTVASSSRPYLDIELETDFYAMEPVSSMLSQTIEAECSKSYKALIINLLKNSTNFFNMQMVFFPANATTPDFVIVSYHYSSESNVSTSLEPDLNKTVWFWSSAVYFFYHPLRIFQFTSLVFSDPLLQQSNLELYLPAECSRASDDYMKLLTQRLKLYAMYQRLHAPIDDNYQAKSHSVGTLIQWHKDHPHVSRLVLSAQVLFPILATLFMTLFFIYVIELEPRNIGRKLNNQVNSSVDYISASGEAKILIILTISILFNVCTLIADSYALKEYDRLAPEVKEYYYHNSVEFRCFYTIPYLMLAFDLLSILYIAIPIAVVVCSYCRNYTSVCTCICKCAVVIKTCYQTRMNGSPSQDNLVAEGENGRNANERQDEVQVQVQAQPSTATAKINWSILLYALLSPFSCIATHAYHVLIAFIDNAYHASSVLLLFIIVLFIHVVVFQKIYYYVCKWRNSKKHSDCCTNFCWTMFILCCYLLGVLTLAIIIGLTVSMLILVPISNAINNAPNNIYIIYQGSVAVIAALVTFQVFFRETNSVAEVFIKARDKMIKDKNRPRLPKEKDKNNEQGTQPDSKEDGKKWEKMSEKEKELHLATVFLEYIFRKTNSATSPPDAQTDPPSDSAPQTSTPSLDPAPPTGESPPKQTLTLVSPAPPKSGATPPSAASQPQTIPGSTVTVMPTAPEQLHTPPTQPQPQPQGLNGQEMSGENVSNQGITIAEIHVHQ